MHSEFEPWWQTLNIRSSDPKALKAMQKNLNRLCISNGGLGKLEGLLLRLAAVQGRECPEITNRAVLVFAADHGVSSEGVSRFSSRDSAKMVEAIVQGQSAVGVLARTQQLPLFCWDVGLANDPAPRQSIFPLFSAKICRGTENISLGGAMTMQQCSKALRLGAEAVKQLPQGTALLALGEMGMANTTAAAALTAALLKVGPALVVGVGAGTPSLNHKVTVVEKALQSNHVQDSTPFDQLTKLGGLEIAALTGACLQAASQGIAIILDGFVTTVAAYLASQLNPAVKEYLFASHLSAEPGHPLLLKGMGIEAPMELELRVGEGAGALLLFPLLDQAWALSQYTVKFCELGIDPPVALPLPGNLLC